MATAIDAGSGTGRTGRETVVYSLVLTAAVLAVFSAVRNYPSLGLDDERILFDNPAVSGGLSLEGISWAFRTMSFTYWQPIPLISHMAAASAFGLDPGRHHLVNLALHAMNTLLLFSVLREMTGSAGRSAAVAAIFGLHPLQVAPVAWIPARTDLLAGTFFLLALRSHARRSKDASRRRYLATMVYLAAGLMSKPSVAALPAVLLLVDFWPLGRLPLPGTGGAAEKAGASTLRRLLLEKAPFAALSVAAAALAYATRDLAGVLSSTDVYSLHVRLRTLPYYYARVLREFLVPAGIEFYPIHPGPGLPSWKVVTSLAVLAAVLAAAIRRRNRFPFFAVGCAWFAAMLLPVAGLVQVGDDGLAARYMYLPMIGLALAFVWGAGEIASAIGLDRRGKSVAAFVLLAAMGAATHAQVGYWKKGTAVFARDVELNPRNYLAHNMLGISLSIEGRTAEAVRHYQEALRLMPDRPFILLNLGNALYGAGRREEALPCFREAIDRAPWRTDWRYVYGLALYRMARYREAEEQFLELLHRDPWNPSVREMIRRIEAARGAGETPPVR